MYYVRHMKSIRIANHGQAIMCYIKFLNSRLFIYVITIFRLYLSRRTVNAIIIDLNLSLKLYNQEGANISFDTIERFKGIKNDFTIVSAIYFTFKPNSCHSCDWNNAT